MTYSSTTVELKCGSGQPERQVKPLSEALSIILQRKIIHAVADFLDAYTLPRGVFLVINGESAEQEIERQALADSLAASIGQKEAAHA